MTGSADQESQSAGGVDIGAGNPLAATSRFIGLLPLALPIMFAEMGESILGVTDTMMLAHVGTTELAAIGVADTIYDLFRVAMIGLVDAIQIVTARRVGQGKCSAVGAAFNQGLALIIVMSLFFTGALKIASPHIASASVNSEGLAAAVDEFLQIVALGIVFHSASMAISALLVSLGRTRALVGSTIVLAVTNFTVGYCLIFGKFGLPEMGIRGAAIGSVVAEAASLAFLVGHTLWHADIKKYALFRMPSRDWRLLRLLLTISWPVTLEALLECVRWFAFFVIIATAGEDVLAFSNIVYCGYALLLIPNGAFAEIANSKVSSFIGAGHTQHIAKLTHRLIAMSIITTAPLIVLLLSFPSAILSLFVDEPELISESVNGLRVVAIALLVVIPGQTWLAAVVGTGDTLASFIIEFAMTCMMLCVAYVGVQSGWPLEWIWAAVPAGWLVALGASLMYIRSRAWERLDV